MSTPVPPSVTVPFANAGDKNTIPVPSQVSIEPGAASFETGFPPATMTDPTAGGVPPSGFDFNGILYMLSSHIAWLAAGGFYVWNEDVVTNMGGYGVGAMVRDAVDPMVIWYNTIDDNEDSPSVADGWLRYRIGGGLSLKDQGAVLPAGTTNNFALTDGTVGRVNYDTSAGDATLTGTLNGDLGQIVTLVNGGTGLLTFAALSVSSSNPFFLPADITIFPQEAKTFRLFNNGWYPL